MKNIVQTDALPFTLAKKKTMNGIFFIMSSYFNYKCG
jgi:hypothetical protein